MCGSCGCSTGRVTTEVVTVEQKILARNDHLAEHNRKWLADNDILAINLMSSPGSGKTTLLERTIQDLDLPVAVVEGDQATTVDADRIRATGRPVVQINTGAGCHLDASMVHTALSDLKPDTGSVVFIENVGNLVCPALFDLGENARVVLMSVTEGPDKPVKYPRMFATADLILLNKVDLLPYLDFSMDLCTSSVAKVNPRAEIQQVSATRGTGMPAWYSWLTSRLSGAVG